MEEESWRSNHTIGIRKNESWKKKKKNQKKKKKKKKNIKTRKPHMESYDAHDTSQCDTR